MAAPITKRRRVYTLTKITPEHMNMAAMTKFYAKNEESIKAADRRWHRRLSTSETR